MTLRNFPPADQCSPETLLAIAEAVGRDPALSYDLAGSRAHIEAICRWAVRQAQHLSEAHEERDHLKARGMVHEASRTRLGDLAGDLLDDLSAVRTASLGLERRLCAATNDLDRVKKERDARQCALAARAVRNDALVADLDIARRERDSEGKRAAALVQTMEAVDQQIDAARIEIRALQSTLDAERNERQGEVIDLGEQRERADQAEAAAEVFETTARAALAILARDRGAQPVDPVPLAEIVRAVDGRLGRALVRVSQHNAELSIRLEGALRRLAERQQTADARLGITGQTIEQVNLELDEELAANPDLGPLHHARDMRDHEGDTTP